MPRMNGAPGQLTFLPNRLVAVLYLVLGALLTLLMTATIADAHGNPSNTHAAWVLGVVSFGLLLAGAWILSCKLVLDDFGFQYRSLFGHREMKWQDIERFTYRSTRRSVNFVPIGTYCRYRFRDVHGQSVSFGTRFRNAAKLGNALIGMTTGPIYQKCAAGYNSGATVDFGKIRVSKNGVAIKKLFRWRIIPLAEVSEYRVQRGHFYIFKKGDKRTTGPLISQVPNAFVLLELLNELLGKKQAAGAPS